MGFLIFLLLCYLLLCYGLYLLFEKALSGGVADELSARDAWIPGLNFGRWAKLVGRSPWYALWLLVPIVNVFIYAGLCIDLARSFGRFSFLDSVLAVLFAPLYFIWLGRQEDAVYRGPILQEEIAYRQEIEKARARKETRKMERLEQESPFKKSTAREWTEALIFAVSAATLIRLFAFEMFTIPTSSMEGSLLVGDYLVVSKAHYGIRTPQTVVMFPLVHNRLPFNLGESYLNYPRLKMRRLPGLESIDRNDPIVFNHPTGDSVYVMPGRVWTQTDVRYGLVEPQQLNTIKHQRLKPIVRPIDKKEHYVKRAVAVAGDTLEIRDRQVYLNGKRGIDPPNIQFRYLVTRPANVPLNFATLYDWGISAEDIGVYTPAQAAQVLAKDRFYAVLNQDQINKLQALSPDISIQPLVDERGSEAAYRLFPNDPENFGDWTKDNYGPIVIPAKGMTVRIGPKNIALYRRIISVYEGHDLEERPGEILIDGKPATSYTFAQDYYWGMGDNRHGSEDSRFWGFIPADHIVGKPLFIWFSTKDANMSNGIRWERIFQGATQMD